MQTLAFLVVAAAGLWLVGVAMMMASRPRECLHFLGLMASSWRINVVEQGLRLLAGLSLVVRAPSSKLPWLFEAFGWFVVATSALLLVLPLRWHAAYSVWWSQKLTAPAVRALAPLSAILGIGLIYAAL